jgi:hypothetical protein
MLSNVENDPDNGQRNDHTLQWRIAKDTEPISAFGTKRTSARACVMSANDP